MRKTFLMSQKHLRCLCVCVEHLLRPAPSNIASLTLESSFGLINPAETEWRVARFTARGHALHAQVGAHQIHTYWFYPAPA